MSCCTSDCNEGRTCPLRTRNGGEFVNTDEPITTPEKASGWTAWALFALAAVTCLCAYIAIARFVEALS